jgi:hypothetical protein
VVVITLAALFGFSGAATAQTQISNWTELNNIRNDLSGNYILINALNENTSGYDTFVKNGATLANGGKGWEPIGSAENTYDFDTEIKAPRFTGTFDGDGHTIAGLIINRGSENYIALFGAIGASATVQNIGLVDVDITGANDVSGLTAFNEGTISNSYVTGTVVGNFGVGGLVGGAVQGSAVSNSYATGSVTGTGSFVGGLVGFNSGTVSNSHATNIVVGSSSTGGLVGTNGTDGKISTSYATGDVSGSGNAIGGLVGFISASTGTIHNSYATGSVSGNQEIGGLLGFSRGNISNSYASGSVSGNGLLGGLLGARESGTVSNSFWDKETSDQTSSARGTGKTTAEMKDINTFTDVDTAGLTQAWNFTVIWTIQDGSYPSLRGDRSPVFTTQPSASTAAGVAFSTQPVVTIQDAQGNTITDSIAEVVLTLTTGSGSLAGTATMNAVAGVADFSGKGLSIDLVGSDKVLTASVTNLTPATTVEFVIKSEILFKDSFQR